VTTSAFIQGDRSTGNPRSGGQGGDFAVSCHGLSRTYVRGKIRKESIVALSDISFDVPKGEIFGIIGPDGSGKTTLFRILTTLILPDTGTATVSGMDILQDYKQIRSRVGYMPGRFSLYQDLSVEENLDVFARVFHTTIEENYHLIEDIYHQLEPFRKRRAGKLSGGMKQKLALCCALIHKPEVLFLDEPTTGVDPVSRKEFWDMLHRLKDEGIAILVSTPYMDEAGLCDRIALMQDGRFMSIDTPEAIVRQFGRPLFIARSSRMSALLNNLRTFQGVRTSYPFGDAHHITLWDDGTCLPALQEFLIEHGHTDLMLSEVAPGVEDCFMELNRPPQEWESGQMTTSLCNDEKQDSLK